MNVEQRVLHIAQLAAIAIISVSCYLVLRPFFAAIVFAVVLCISTWPLYVRLRRWLKGRASLAALLMILMLVMLIIIPSAMVAVRLVDNVANIASAAQQFLEHGAILPPAWVKEIPLLGKQFNQYWIGIASGGKEAVTLFTELLEPTRKVIFSTAVAIGHSVVQMGFSAFIVFFLYRDGDALMRRLRTGLLKLAGNLGEELLTTIHHTVAGVVQGIFGAALAQSFLATTGFIIAGVPAPFLLGAATFLLSMIPIGPPLVWGGAAIWLFNQELYGWAFFMVVWGIFAISSIDNVVRPYLISQSNQLSLLVNVLGVFGGIIAFGFIGIFIGPPILVVGLTLARVWTERPLQTMQVSNRHANDAPAEDKPL